MIKIAALWKQKTQKGTGYLSGKLGEGVRIMIFQNNQQQSEKSPTHYVYLAEVEKKEGGWQKKKPQQKGDDFMGAAPKKAYAEQAPQDAPHPVAAFENATPIEDDDIPF